MDLIIWAIILFALCPHTSGVENEGCSSPQYLEIGETGVIKCTFQRSFYGVLWFHSAQADQETPFLKLLGSEKSGDGYLSGEYDIYRDASLIINNVTKIYDRNFTVAKFDSLAEEPVTYEITVITTVTPNRGQPQIDQCRNNNRSCAITQGADASTISCYIGPSRPAIELKWFLRRVNDEKLIHCEKNSTGDSVTYTSHAAIPDVFPDQSFLNLLVCRADSVPGMLSGNEAFVVLQNRHITPLNVISKKIYAKRGSTLQIPCSRTRSNLMIWKRSENLNESFSIVAYAIFSERIFNSYFTEYKMDIDGSLVVPMVTIEHEGVYECSFENHDAPEKSVYELVVYVPATPVVRGCFPNLTCALDVPDKGQLICDVFGIRPLVKLEWNLVYEHDSDYLTFTDNEVTFKQTGNVYDVKLSSKFRIKDADWVYVLPVECTITETDTEDLAVATRVNLMPKTVWGSDVPFYLALVGYIAVLLILLWALQIAVHRIIRPKQRDRNQNNSNEQNIPLNVIHPEDNIQNEISPEDNIQIEISPEDNIQGPESNNPEEETLSFKKTMIIKGLLMVYLFIVFIGFLVFMSLI